MFRRLSLCLGMALMLGVIASTPSAAQTILDQPVRFTFSAPVTLPGMTLPAGQYEFKLARSASDRQIVQVFDDKGKSRGVLMAIAAVRADSQPVPEKAEITFMETPVNMPQAVKVYWYPGIRTGGHEFVYPRAQAQLIAKASTTGVLTTTGADANSGNLTRLSANGESTDVSAQKVSAPAAAETPAPASVEANAPPRPALVATCRRLPATCRPSSASDCWR